MAEYLFLTFAVASTLDIVALGLTASFFDKKWSLKDLLVRFLTTTLTVCLLVLGGMALGKLGTQYVDGTLANWFASSLMFLLAVKMVFDGLKTAKFKRSINPTVFSGLLALSVFTGINAFIYSLAFGLMNVRYSMVWWFAPLFFAALLATSILGRRQQRLHHIYNGWIMVLVALFGAIYTIVSK